MPVLTERQRSLAFATVMLAFVLDIVDSTIVNTALPTIQTDLGASAGAIQWVVAGYFLSFAVLLVAGGRAGDLYGYRRMFLGGVAAFTIASMACGLATSGTQLLACRLAQGAAAAVMAPQVIALVQLMFSPLERVSRLAVFGIVGGIAAIAGPILGGLLIEANLWGLGWRLIFLINGPIGVAALVAGWRLLPEGRSPHPLRLDAGGTVLLAAALLALLVPLIQGDAAGWPWWALGLLAAAPLLLVVFWRRSVRRVARIGSALIAPELFAEPTFRLGLAITLAFGTATTGFLLVLSMTLQRQLGFTPLATALVHVPFGLGVMAGIALIGRRLLPRLGSRVITGGAAAMIAGCAGVVVTVALAPGSLVALAAAMALAGVGMGSIVGPLGPVTLARVDRGHAGVAGGMHNGVQQIGGALGSATVGTLFFATAAGGYAHALAASTGLIAVLLAVVAALAMALPARIFAVEGP